MGEGLVKRRKVSRDAVVKEGHTAGKVSEVMKDKKVKIVEEGPESESEEGQEDVEEEQGDDKGSDSESGSKAAAKLIPDTAGPSEVAPVKSFKELVSGISQFLHFRVLSSNWRIGSNGFTM